MAYHVPVMRTEVLDALNLTSGRRVVDATLGGGGHARAIAERIAPGGLLIGLDQDSDALAEVQRTLENWPDTVTVRLIQTNFEGIADSVRDFLLENRRVAAGDSFTANSSEICLGFAEGVSGVDGVLFDLGVSSHQLDVAERGFALRYNGPLDMRMNRESGGETAAELLNRLPEAEIARLLFEYGEEPRARRVAAEIVQRRQIKPLETTEDLVDAVRGAMPLRTRPGEIHPATKVFQAVRIAVNRELDVLETALRSAAQILAPGGRLVVIAYHSLEDRIVKNLFAELSGKRVESDFPNPEPVAEPILTILTKKPVVPGDEEIRMNPRARSAKMRVAQRKAG